MFAWFETRVNPYPSDEPSRPPQGLFAFILHYSRPVLGWLILMAVLTAAIGVGEVMLFNFLGRIVDWLSKADPKTFLAQEAGTLWFMGLFSPRSSTRSCSAITR
jgi:ATP-binding cassette subfamily B multidrug efflux pump